MAAATETNTATLYPSNPTTSSSVGTSFSGLNFSCGTIPLLKSNAINHPKNPAAGGIVTWIVGSFQKNRIH
jgi:hypothetical protein